MTAEPFETVRLASAVYGSGPDVADPAELFHEASKLGPSLMTRQMRGVARLSRDPHLLASSARAVRRHTGLPTTRLPDVELPPLPLRAALRERRSVRSFTGGAIDLAQLAALLRATYGVTKPPEAELPPLRSVPSAGALYPLELFVLAQNVAGLERTVYHYDPLGHRLERHPPPSSPGHAPLFADDVADGAPAVVFVAAVFWRSRFKYALRGYRFTLLEAGHVTQNLVLGATALGLGSVVLGSFFDTRVDALLGLDGVDESTLIAACLGAAA